MSNSDNSTGAPSRDNEEPHQLLDGCMNGVGDGRVNYYERSPYAHAQMVSLDVGTNATRFDIHGTILCQSPELAAKFDFWRLTKQPVPMPDIDEAVAHTLVHYLYTGRYQTLHADTPTCNAMSPDYKLSTCVYCAAVRYNLLGLVELARENIVTFSEDVNIFDVLAIAKDHALPHLPESDRWYRGYLEDAIRSAMLENPEPFRNPDFITHVEGSSRLLQLVWKIVMENYARRYNPPLAMIHEAVNLRGKLIPAEVTAVATEFSQAIPQSPDSRKGLESKTGAAQFPKELGNRPSPSSEDRIAEQEASSENTFDLEEIEPSEDTPNAPEPFTDELGFKSSKTYQQMGRKAEVNIDADQVMEDKSNPGCTRSDSVMQGELVLDRDRSVLAMEIGATDDIAQSTTELNACATQSKKAKKQKKKKASSLVINQI